MISLQLAPDQEQELRRMAGQLGITPELLASEGAGRYFSRLFKAILEYRAGESSIGGFAHEMGISVIEADSLLARLNIPPRDDDLDLATEDAETIERVMRNKGS